MRYIFLLFFLSNSLFASTESLISFNNGQVNIGQKNLELGLKNFNIIYDLPHKNLKASFIKDTLRWIRTKDNIYTPIAEMLIQIRPSKSETLHIVYEDQTYTPSQNAHSTILSFNLTISLFRYTNIQIYQGKNLINTIKVMAIPKRGVQTHHIDPSCAPFHLQVLNFKNQYLSLFCRLERLGRLGKEKPKLLVFWTTPNFKLIGKNAKLPYLTTFSHSSQATFTLTNEKGEKEALSFQVLLPKRLHRVKTAIGIGPYQLETKDALTKESSKIVPDLTLYGNIGLAKNSSIRFFDSYAQKSGSLFNNFGLYFAYDLASAKNGTINLVALLGFQHILYDHPGHHERTTQFIAPQGAEITVRHPFGIKNYILGGGGFFSIKESITYKNTWLRFGKKLMIELNYIEWGYQNESAKVYGLSFIYPLASFF